MILDRKPGDRVRVSMHAIGARSAMTHDLLESDLNKIWNRVAPRNDPRYTNPRYVQITDGWSVVSSLTGEVLATCQIVGPPKGRPRP